MITKLLPSWSSSIRARWFRAELCQLSKCSQACGGCVWQDPSCYIGVPKQYNYLYNIPIVLGMIV